MHQTQTAQVTPATETASPAITSLPVSLATIAPPPTWTPAPILLLPTIFKLPTATGTHYTPTTDPALLAAGCNNLQLIYDVNVPAGSVFRAGESFTKTWKVANIVTFDWFYNYPLAFNTASQMVASPSTSDH